MRGGVTTWILGREKGELVAGMLSSVGEEEIDWQLIDSDVVGGPAALHTDHNSRGNPIATVHGSGELHSTGLTPNAPETRVSPLEAIAEPTIGGAYDGPLMTHSPMRPTGRCGSTWSSPAGSRRRSSPRTRPAPSPWRRMPRAR